MKHHATTSFLLRNSGMLCTLPVGSSYQPAWFWEQGYAYPRQTANGTWTTVTPGAFSAPNYGVRQMVPSQDSHKVTKDAAIPRSTATVSRENLTDRTLGDSPGLHLGKWELDVLRNKEFHFEAIKRLSRFGFDRDQVDAILNERGVAATVLWTKEELQGESWKLLAPSGFQDDRIRATWDPVKMSAKDKDPYKPAHRPTYPTIHLQYLELETLKFYGLPWEWDQSESEHVVILREMKAEDTDVLFEHTEMLRSRRLKSHEKSSRKYLHPRQEIGATDSGNHPEEDEPDYAWAKRRGIMKPNPRLRYSYVTSLPSRFHDYLH